MSEGRVLVWYSDGAASAVAAKLAVEEYGDRCQVVKCDTTNDEHEDNLRFRQDVERWIGREVVLIRSEKYSGIDEVFERERYMSGVAGAKCTSVLKKLPRFDFQRPDDVHVFGYTADRREVKRAKDFEMYNPDLVCDWILIRSFVRKKDAHRIIREAGIRSPFLYTIGFDHNNCKGCVKAQSPAYWARTRLHFPEVFARRARQSREIGARLVKLHGVRIFLDELPADFPVEGSDGNIECGPFCEMDRQSSIDFEAA